MISERSGRAVALFDDGFSCSQAIRQAYGEEYGLSPADAGRIAAGFDGGMARADRICGAVSGGVMVPGLAFGGVCADDGVSRGATYAAAQDFSRHSRQSTTRPRARTCSDSTPEIR